MLKGSGWRKGQECAHSWHKNHPLGFIGRGKVLSQIMWPGMEARVRKNDGTLEAPSTQIVDTDGWFVDRQGMPRKATLNRLRSGRDGAFLEGTYTTDNDSDLSDLGLIGSPGPTRNLNTLAVTDPLGGNAATEIIYPSVAASSWAFLTANYGSNQSAAGASVWLRVASGTATVYLSTSNSAYDTHKLTTCLLTTQWQKFSVGGSTRRYVILGYDDRVPGEDVTNSDQTIYAWGWTLQNQFPFGTGTVIGDNPITVTGDDLRYDNTGEALTVEAEGTIIVEVKPSVDAVDTNSDLAILDVRRGTLWGSRGIFLWISASNNTLRLHRNRSGTSSNLYGTTIPVAEQLYVVAFTWKTDGGTELFVGGISEGEKTNTGAAEAHSLTLDIGKLGDMSRRWFGSMSKFTSMEPVLSSRQVENANAVIKRVA